jgi:hypothetical protein
MLVMKTIKDPPDNMSGFCGINYSELSSWCDLDDDTNWIVRNSTHVQITSQVERTEPDEMAVEESDEVYTKRDSDTIEEALSAGYDEGEHTSMAGEGRGIMEAELERDMECTDDGGTMDTGPVAATTGDDDQEDTSEQPDLDIQFVRVITT